MYKLIFWDWTGTLADEEALDRAVYQSMEEEISSKKEIPLSDAERIFTDYLQKLENKVSGTTTCCMEKTSVSIGKKPR